MQSYRISISVDEWRSLLKAADIVSDVVSNSDDETNKDVAGDLFSIVRRLKAAEQRSVEREAMRMANEIVAARLKSK